MHSLMVRWRRATFFELALWGVVALALLSMTFALRMLGGPSVELGLEDAPADNPVGDGSTSISAAGPSLPASDVRFVAIDRSGTTWFRLASRSGQDDRIRGIDRDGTQHAYDNLSALVEARYDDLLRRGSLTDFWAIDPDDRVWIGAAYFDGSAWREVASDEQYLGGSLDFEDRVVIDRDGVAWVPYLSRGDCRSLLPCEMAGIMAFDEDGAILDDLVIDVIPELARRDLPFVRFESLPDGTVVAAGGRVMYRLPSSEAIVYPGMEVDPSTGMRNPGFIGSASARPDGRIAVFPWVEPLVDNPRPMVSEATWSGNGWESEDLAASPLFEDGTQATIITASGYDAEGALWLASSLGEVAVRRGDRWIRHFTEANSPLGMLVRDLAVDADETVWIATSQGLRLYERGEWHTGIALHLPMLIRSTCPFGAISPDC